MVRLTLSRSHRQLDTDLEHSLVLRPCRQALQEEGLDWRLQPSGAKIFMEPWCLRAIRGPFCTIQVKPCDILVTEDLEEGVMGVVRQLSYSLRVFPRSCRNIAFTDSEGGGAVLVSRSFLNIPAAMLVNPSSVAQSTTEARTRQVYHGTNPRRFQLHPSLHEEIRNP